MRARLTFNGAANGCGKHAPNDCNWSAAHIEHAALELASWRPLTTGPTAARWEGRPVALPSRIANEVREMQGWPEPGRARVAMPPQASAQRSGSSTGHGSVTEVATAIGRAPSRMKAATRAARRGGVASSLQPAGEYASCKGERGDHVPTSRP